MKRFLSFLIIWLIILMGINQAVINVFALRPLSSKEMPLELVLTDGKKSSIVNNRLAQFENELEQLTANRGFEVNSKTKFILFVCGRAVVSGDKKYINAFREFLGIDVVRVSYEVENTEKLAETLELIIQSNRVIGAMITQPWKIESFNILQKSKDTSNIKMTDIVLKVGAINHITKFSDYIFLDSSDGEAFIKGYEEIFPNNLKERGVMLLGCGGSGREIAVALAAYGVGEIHLVEIPHALYKARNLKKSLTQMYNIRVTISTPDSKRFKDYAKKACIIINASDVGMNKFDRKLTPFSNIKKLVSPDQVVIDIIVSPDVTGLLEQAFSVGANVYNGLNMSRLTTVSNILNWTETLLGKNSIQITEQELLEKITMHSEQSLGRLDAMQRLQHENCLKKEIQISA